MPRSEPSHGSLTERHRPVQALPATQPYVHGEGDAAVRLLGDLEVLGPLRHVPAAEIEAEPVADVQLAAVAVQPEARQDDDLVVVRRHLDAEAPHAPGPCSHALCSQVFPRW